MTRAFMRRPAHSGYKLDGRIVVQVDDRFYLLDEDNLEPLDWRYTEIWLSMPDEGNSIWVPV